jgi:hypothetical protein
MTGNMGEDAGVAWENAECGNLHVKFADRQSASQFAKRTMVAHARYGRPPGGSSWPKGMQAVGNLRHLRRIAYLVSQPTPT